LKRLSSNISLQTLLSRHSDVGLIHPVSPAVAESELIRAHAIMAHTIMPQSIEAFGKVCRLDLIIYWKCTSDQDHLVCRQTWATPTFDARNLLDYVSALQLWPTEGLPGKVWAYYQRRRLREMADDRHAGRSMHFAKAGIRATEGIPVFEADRFSGVLELLARDPSVLEDNVQWPEIKRPPK
jgi:hypothetical protein